MISSRDTSRVAMHRKTVSPPRQIASLRALLVCEFHFFASSSFCLFVFGVDYFCVFASLGSGVYLFYLFCFSCLVFCLIMLIFYQWSMCMAWCGGMIVPFDSRCWGIESPKTSFFFSVVLHFCI